MPRIAPLFVTVCKDPLLPHLSLPLQRPKVDVDEQSREPILEPILTRFALALFPCLAQTPGFTMSASPTASGPPDSGDPGRGPMLIAVRWVFTSLSIIFVGLRFYSRRRKRLGYGWDDWLMLMVVVRKPPSRRLDSPVLTMPPLDGQGRAVGPGPRPAAVRLREA